METEHKIIEHQSDWSMTGMVAAFMLFCIAAIFIVYAMG